MEHTGKIIDIHCHLPLPNVDFKEKSEFGLSRFALASMSVHLLNMGLRFNPNFDLLREHIKDKVFSITRNSLANAFVILALDGSYNDKGERIGVQSPLYTSNEVVLEFTRNYKKMLPGFSINPKRKDAFEQLEFARDAKAALIKQLPGVQHFDPASTEFSEFYQKAAEYDIPILIHVGPEFAFPGIKVNHAYHRLERLIPILEQGTRVIAAHAGGFSVIAEKRDVNYLESLLQKYPNLYIDNSALSSWHRKQRAYSILKSELALSRTIFGSDYPIKPIPNAFALTLGLRKLIMLNKMKKINPIDCDIEIKRSLKFSEATFSRGYQVINPKSAGAHLNI